MLKLIRLLVSPVLGAIDALNARWEPFKAPDPALAVIPPLDTLQFKLAATSRACKMSLPKHIKSDVFFWDVLDIGAGGNVDMGDHCLWQGIYLAYLANIGDVGQVTKVIVEGLIPLSTYGGPGVLLRGVAHISDFTPPANDPSFFIKDDWVCRSDASMGSLLGFCYGLTYALEAPSTKGRVDADLIRKLAENVANSVIANDYRIVKHDGTPTDWGNLKPGLLQAPCRILGLLALLKLSGKEELYSKIYKESEPFLEYGETHLSVPGVPNMTFHPWYQDHLAFMTYDMLLMLDKDPKRRRTYLKGLRRLWNKDKHWWNVYFAAVACKYLEVDDTDYAFAMVGLFDYAYPDVKVASQVNSSKPGVELVTYDGKVRSARPLRVCDRPPTNYLWQRNPYQLDGSPVWGYSGLDFLFPYSIFSTWVTRFKKAIQ